MSGDVLQVVAAVIRNRRGEVLIARRPQHLHQGGFWEFPGGKLEPSETHWQALQRELHEELGIDAQQGTPLFAIRHAYPERVVRLHIWRVERYRGRPRGREGQAVAWVPPEVLPRYPFPAANRTILRALSLPDRYLITPAVTDEGGFLGQLEQALAGGVRLLQLRCKGLEPGRIPRLLERVTALARRSGARLLLNSDLPCELLDAADGLHLTSRALMALRERPLADDRLLAASCHNAAELAQAAAIGADFVTLSPLRATASHPTAAPLGWRRFAELVAAAGLPVYALGGVVPADLGRVRDCGAFGVAGISAFHDGVAQR